MERGRVGSNSSGASGADEFCEVDEDDVLFVEKEGGARCGWAA
jgi:hypothetical protein